MKIIKLTLFILSWIILSNLLLAQTSKVGTTGAQFLKIGVGAGAVGRGEAFVATANDISAIFWNPAGLTQLKQREAMFMHSNWLASLSFDFAGITLPLGETVGTLSFFTTILSTPEDVVRTVYYPEGTGETFQSVDLALGVSYARNLTDQLSVGTNVKYIRQSVWKMHGNSWALDFGVMYQAKVRNLKAGLAISNFGVPIKFAGESASLFVDSDPNFTGNTPVKAMLQTESWELPLAFRFGLAFDALQMRHGHLTLSADMINPNDNNEYANFGCEYAIKNLVFIRAGYRGLGMEESEGGLTVGGGLTFPIVSSQLSINYAFVNYGRLEATHRYDLAITF